MSMLSTSQPIGENRDKKGLGTVPQVFTNLKVQVNYNVILKNGNEQHDGETSEHSHIL